MSNLTPDTCWEDIVFEGRNKDYGAYPIRYSYPFNLTIASLLVVALFISIIIAPVLFREDQAPINAKPQTTKPDITIFDPLPPIEHNIVIPKPVVAKPVKIENAVPVITNEVVEEKDMMSTTDEVKEFLDNAYARTEGANIEITDVLPMETIAPAAPIETPVAVAPPEPAPAPVVKAPEFPGGNKALVKWLSAHLNYPPMAQKMGIEGQVVVEFTVDMDGRVSDATIVKSLHRLCDQEAIRLVKSMPAWTPGESDGEKVVARRTLPIRFVLE
jgi:periplasmic protein TonB